MCQVGGEQTNPLAFGSDGPCEKEIECTQVGMGKEKNYEEVNIAGT